VHKKKSLAVTTMHEIITLQLGSQANYVGTHFWNTQGSYFTYGSQEESPIDHDIHFRAGIGADGSDTYLPRAVIYDFKAGFGTLRRVNELYEVVEGGNASGNGNVWYVTFAVILLMCLYDELLPLSGPVPSSYSDMRI